MTLDNYTKTAWTILAISLSVISEIGFKNFHPTGGKVSIYMRNKKKRNGLEWKQCKVVFLKKDSGN